MEVLSLIAARFWGPLAASLVIVGMGLNGLRDPYMPRGTCWLMVIAGFLMTGVLGIVARRSLNNPQVLRDANAQKLPESLSDSSPTGVFLARAVGLAMVCGGGLLFVVIREQAFLGSPLLILAGLLLVFKRRA